jgi:integrase
MEPETPVAEVIAGFVQHLLDRRGMAANTAVARARYVREFLADEFDAEPIEIGRIGLSTTTEFLVAQRGRWCPATMKAAATALRSFFRYLALEQGGQTDHLAASVPTIAGWRLATVPRVLEESEVRTILASFDRGTAIGRRQFASTMCLAFLGLRTQEVSALSIDDIDWRAGTVRVAATKTRRSDVLPLPDPVARAILAYLRGGRPKTASRQIFVRHAPSGAPAGAETVRSAVRLACARAGLDPHISTPAHFGIPSQRGCFVGVLP